MMHHKTSQLPKEIYHRLYSYAKRNVDPVRIAAAMNLPLKTVHYFISRFNSEKDAEPPTRLPDPAAQSPSVPARGDFLDTFIFAKTRHSIVDISGSIDKHHVGKLRDTLMKLSSSHRNPLALKMTDVQFIDATGAEMILSLYAEFKQRGRYCAILDPSPEIEPILKQHKIDKEIPIFGTELAFEEHAFK